MIVIPWFWQKKILERIKEEDVEEAGKEDPIRKKGEEVVRKVSLPLLAIGIIALALLGSSRK